MPRTAIAAPTSRPTRPAEGHISDESDQEDPIPEQVALSAALASTEGATLETSGLHPHGLSQKPETMSRIVSLTRAGKSPRRINIMLALEGFPNSKGRPWTVASGNDLKVIHRVLVSQPRCRHKKMDAGDGVEDSDNEEGYHATNTYSEDDEELREQAIAALHEEGGTAAVLAAAPAPNGKLKRVAPSAKARRGSKSLSRPASRGAKRSGKLPRRGLSENHGTPSNKRAKKGQTPPAERTARCAGFDSYVDLDDSQSHSQPLSQAGGLERLVHQAEEVEAEEAGEEQEQEGVEGGCASEDSDEEEEEEEAAEAEDVSRGMRKRNAPTSYLEATLVKKVESKAKGRPMPRRRLSAKASPGTDPGKDPRTGPRQDAQAEGRSGLCPEPPTTSARTSKRGRGSRAKPQALAPERAASVAPPTSLEQLGPCLLEVARGDQKVRINTQFVANFADLLSQTRVALGMDRDVRLFEYDDPADAGATFRIGSDGALRTHVQQLAGHKAAATAAGALPVLPLRVVVGEPVATPLD